jgi:hypothetical protein
MGVLDELKQQAKDLQAGREKRETSREGQHSVTERRLRSRMSDLHAYFKELLQHLKLVDPEITKDFYVIDLCTLKGLRQARYRLTSDNPVHVNNFTFYYDLVGNRTNEVKLPNKLVAAQKKESLWRYGFRCKLKEYSPSCCSLLIEEFVPVSFEFGVDRERAAIRLKVKNKPMPGIYTYTYDPDQVDAKFMDETAKYILERPNGFDELSGNTVPEQTLVRLRDQLNREKNRGREAKNSLAKKLFRKKA